MLTLYQKFINSLEYIRDLPPLFFRLILSYGFYGPAMMKIGNINGIIDWFTSMRMPLPALNAYLSTGTEVAGFILLFLGLGTRLISLPLIIVMIVAILTVHIGNGFAAGDNGFEIPLYYLLMLFSLVITGPGRISLDALLNRYIQKQES